MGSYISHPAKNHGQEDAQSQRIAELERKLEELTKKVAERNTTPIPTSSRVAAVSQENNNPEPNPTRHPKRTQPSAVQGQPKLPKLDNIQSEENIEPVLIRKSNGAPSSWAWVRKRVPTHAQMQKFYEMETILRCTDFLSYLLFLERNNGREEKPWRDLIQGMIDGKVISWVHVYCELEKALRPESHATTHATFFLKRSIPLVRQALKTGEIMIEGIRPPPLAVDGLSLLLS